MQLGRDAGQGQPRAPRHEHRPFILHPRSAHERGLPKD